MPTPIMIKSHVLTDDLVNYVNSICDRKQVQDNTYQIYFVHVPNEIKACDSLQLSKLKARVLQPTSLDISSMYTNGFINMHLSNHWINMWFWKNVMQGKATDGYLWSIEYDVRISSDPFDLFDAFIDNTTDLIYPMGNYNSDSHSYCLQYSGTKLRKFFLGYLQICRMSLRLLQYLDEMFTIGENGPDELIVFSLIHGSNFTSINLKKYMSGVWTWNGLYSDYNRHWYRKGSREGKCLIFHPVK